MMCTVLHDSEAAVCERWNRTKKGGADLLFEAQEKMLVADSEGRDDDLDRAYLEAAVLSYQIGAQSPKGTVMHLNGKPLTKWLTTFQLGDCRKLFRYRAAQRGATPSLAEIDEALWQVLENERELPELYRPAVRLDEMDAQLRLMYAQGDFNEQEYDAIEDEWLRTLMELRALEAAPKRKAPAIGRTFLIIAAAAMVAVAIAPTTAFADAWSQPGWATRLAQALSAGAACGKQVNVGTAGAYLFGAQDSELGQIPANNEMISAVVEAMKQPFKSNGPNCETAMQLFGPNGTAAPGLLSDK